MNKLKKSRHLLAQYTEVNKMEIDKDKFEDFEAVRESGVTNMLATTTVSELSGLERDEVREIIKNYDKYADKWGKK